MNRGRRSRNPAGYWSRSKKWSCLPKDDLLAMLTGVKSKQRTSYIDFVSKGEPEEIEVLFSEKFAVDSWL
jgi:hypothetical protein